MKFVLLAVGLVGATANAWVDGAYDCHGNAITIASATIAGDLKTPFVSSRSQDGRTAMQGFAIVIAPGDGTEILKLNYAEYAFKNGEMYAGTSLCTLKK